MPKIIIEKILSFSSEDPQHPASNLLLSDPAKKWKCAQAGERNATIVLQLEKAVQLSGIDIGNEHSAYIEVLVSRSSADDEFKPLIGMTSFMTPFEARQSQNINKVRMFASNDLAQPECTQKWDRVKIVCIQPYNKHIQYGLSFITIHTNEGAIAEKKNIGKFTLRPDSPTMFSVGSLFKREKEAASPKGIAAAIREASNKPSLSPHKSPIIKKPLRPSTSQISSDDGKNTKRNRMDLLYTEEDEAPNEKIDKLIEKKQQEDKVKADTPKAKKTKNANEKASENDELSVLRKRKVNSDAEEKTPNKKTNVSTTDENSSPKPGPSRRNKRPSTEELPASPKKKAKVDKKHQTKPYEKLLEGVVIVISGIQNPERANLRTSALGMGAKYKPDWDNSCTHLICAFANTPKFNQVRGKGKIVKKQWITECQKERKRLPWRRFALDRNDLTGNESEEEIWEQDPEQLDVPDSEEEQEAADTDEEIERIQKKESNQQQETTVNKVSDRAREDDEPKTAQNGTTNEREDELMDVDIPTLPNYFSNFTFYLSSTLGIIKKQLTKYIVAYDGKIIEEEDELDEEDLAITYSDSDDEVQRLKERTSKVISPTWLLECHNKKLLLPYDDFLIN